MADTAPAGHSRLPGDREEAVALDPTLRAKAGKGVVWTVDPVDGTANFANGNDRFCVMVALVNDGVPQQSWIYCRCIVRSIMPPQAAVQRRCMVAAHPRAAASSPSLPRLSAVVTSRT